MMSWFLSPEFTQNGGKHLPDERTEEEAYRKVTVIIILYNSGERKIILQHTTCQSWTNYNQSRFHASSVATVSMDSMKLYKLWLI